MFADSQLVRSSDRSRERHHAVDELLYLEPSKGFKNRPQLLEYKFVTVLIGIAIAVMIENRQKFRFDRETMETRGCPSLYQD